MSNTTKQTESKGTKPSHNIYINSYFNGSPIRVLAGVAWKHSKGEGFNISLNDMVVFERKDENTASSTKTSQQPKP